MDTDGDEPLVLAEIPRRIQGVRWIKVGLEQIWDEPGRSIVGIDVARVSPGRNDPSRREFAGWEIETFPPEVLEYLVVSVTYVAPMQGREFIDLAAEIFAGNTEAH